MMLNGLLLNVHHHNQPIQLIQSWTNSISYISSISLFGRRYEANALHNQLSDGLLSFQYEPIVTLPIGGDISIGYSHQICDLKKEKLYLFYRYFMRDMFLKSIIW